jgi:HPt (histidine-containing phosphotransfer) domain-containing protein
MDAYVSKPIQAEELFRTVEGLIPRTGRAADSSRIQRDGTGTDTLDAASLVARLGDDAKLLRRLVKVFLHDCPRMMSEMKKAITAANADALAKAAHSFKGAASNFGGTQAVQMARQLEACGRQRDLITARQIYQQLERTTPFMVEALRAVARPAGKSKVRKAMAKSTTLAPRHREARNSKEPT